MLRTLITETYGGKIDDEGDFALLTSLVQRIMTPTAYEIGHRLVESTAEDGEEGALVVPAGTGYKEYMAWVNKLPEREPPTYLGLPSNAEKLVLVEMGRELCGNVGRIVGALDEGERVMAEAAEAA
jgi:dynein heavy chain 1